MFSAQSINAGEDRFCAKFDKNNRRALLSVFDGHGGAETADYVAAHLPDAILAHPPEDSARQFKLLDDQLLANFMNDQSLFRRKSPAWQDNARRIKAGCTGLVADIDLDSLQMTVSNAGDCRLIVVSLATDTPVVKFQTHDLNTKSAAERERLAREHPGEDQIIVSNRLFGRLMTTRGFGDGYFKLPRPLLSSSGPSRKHIKALSSLDPTSHKLSLIDIYPSLFYAYKTPPYITAVPETFTVSLQSGDVIVLATDGLWDLVSSEDVAEIIQRSLHVVTTTAHTHQMIEGESHPDDNATRPPTPSVHNHAQFILDAASKDRPPGDDVTVIFFQV